MVRLFIPQNSDTHHRSSDVVVIEKQVTWEMPMKTLSNFAGEPMAPLQVTKRLVSWSELIQIPIPLEVVPVQTARSKNPSLYS